MRYIPSRFIIIDPDRQRQDFEPEAMQELCDSIERQGLFHPVVVREVEGRSKLVAGERRKKAMDQLHELGIQFKFNNEWVPQGDIPTVTLGELDPYQAAEAELEENIKRRDLTWQEHAAATAKLHALRQAQAHDRGEQHRVADTAIELHGRADGSYQEATRQEILVSKYLDDADVSKAKTAAEAFKIIKKKEGLQRAAELGAEVGKTFGKHLHRVIHGDCLEWMQAQCAEQFDVIITDPPYGMGADEFGDAAGKLSGTEHHYKDDEYSFKVLMDKWVWLSFAVTKPQAHLYLCCDIEQFVWLRDRLAAVGWQVFRTPIINWKVNSGRVPWPEHGPRRSWEAILYAIKGKRPVNFIAPDIMQTQGDAQLGHGAQKPVALFTELLRRSIRPGDHVLDTFAGTGPVFPAAHGLQCVATGIEQNDASYGLCVERVRGLE